MQIKLLSHASLLIQHNGSNILTDPWFFGTAFNDGWELFPLPDLNLLKESIAKIDVIWLSHEHPDHLHFPTLKWLKEYVKPSVKIYMQQTNSDKVRLACKKIGFSNFVSMPHKLKFKINDEVQIAIYAHRQLDSALAVFIKSKFWLLNINDTELNSNDTKAIQRIWGSPTVLYNQFSIAGTDGIIQKLKSDAESVINRIIKHHNDLNAKMTVPFASFIRFARRDNNYVNEFANKLEHIKSRFSEKGLVLCLQSFKSGNLLWNRSEDLPINLDEVNELAEVEYNNLEIPTDNDEVFQYTVVEREKVVNTVVKKISEWKKNTNLLVWRQIQPVYILVPDWGCEVWVIDFSNMKFSPTTNHSENYDLKIYSQPLFQAFTFPFGIQTLGVSGRYTMHPSYDSVPKNWKLVRIISSLHNAELSLSLKCLFKLKTLKWLFTRKSEIFSQILQQVNRFLKL